MDKTQANNQKIIYNLMYFIFVLILGYLFGLGIHLELSLSLQFLFVLLGSMIIKIVLFYPIILYILLIIGLLGGFLVHHYITPFLIPFLERIYFFSENIVNHLLGKENIFDENLLLFWGILILLISLFNGIILFKDKNIYLLLPVYIGTFLYYWYNFYDISYFIISIFFFGFFILMGLDQFFKEAEQLKKNEIKIEKLYDPWIKTVVKYSILIVGISLLLPKNYNYIQWPWLQQQAYQTFPFIEDLRSYDAFTRDVGEASLFNFSMTGTGETSRLGGPVNPSDKMIMTVYSSEGNYLRGNVQQTYTGNQWQRIKSPSRAHTVGKNFSNWTKDMDPYYKYITLTIQNHDFASTTLFSPYKPAFVDIKDGSHIILSHDDIVEFPHGVFEGESYSIWAQKPLPYDVLIFSGMNFTKDAMDDLDIYLQIPEDKISDRTKNLTKEIVRGELNDYKKAQAIEDYLRKNFDYNLQPDEIPEGQEFIDYFLFEGQEGYCTYYATTMAMMLRLEGIPSRYIEGYLALEPVEEGIYEVRHQNAHAWVEAFIEPVGWIQFEPTPAFPILNPMVDTPTEIIDEIVDRDILMDERPEMDMDFERSEVLDDSELGSGGFPLNDENLMKDGYDFRSMILFILIGLALILPIRYFIGIFKWYSSKSKANQLPRDQRAIYLYSRILRLMDMMGYPQQRGETHNEYAQRVSYKFYELSEDDTIGFKEITDIFVRSKYGWDTTDEDLLILEAYREKLEKRLKNRLGRINFYYNKYVRLNL